MKEYTSTLNVTVKGVAETHEYEYVQYESVQDAVSSIGEDAALKLINRMAKVDARNQEAAKHTPAKTLTEEQKIANKEKARKERDAISRLKAKAQEAGVSVEEYLASL